MVAGVHSRATEWHSSEETDTAAKQPAGRNTEELCKAHDVSYLLTYAAATCTQSAEHLVVAGLKDSGQHACASNLVNGS
jgi:hypothetical protein